jgi:hypothetical protein
MLFNAMSWLRIEQDELDHLGLQTTCSAATSRYRLYCDDNLLILFLCTRGVFVRNQRELNKAQKKVGVQVEHNVLVLHSLDHQLHSSI